MQKTRIQISNFFYCYLLFIGFRSNQNFCTVPFNFFSNPSKYEFFYHYYWQTGKYHQHFIIEIVPIKIFTDYMLLFKRKNYLCCLLLLLLLWPETWKTFLMTLCFGRPKTKLCCDVNESNAHSTYNLYWTNETHINPHKSLLAYLFDVNFPCTYNATFAIERLKIANFIFFIAVVYGILYPKSL